MSDRITAHLRIGPSDAAKKKHTDMRDRLAGQDVDDVVIALACRIEDLEAEVRRLNAEHGTVWTP